MPPRASSAPTYLPALDGLRCACCAAVTASHCFLSAELQQGPGGRFLEGLGRAGVDVFFSLSGFLITRLLLAEARAPGGVDLRAFYARRALRIWPAYYVAVALGFGLARVGGARVLQALGYGSSLQGADFFESLRLFLLFLSNWSERPVPLTLGRLWSVALEEQFYLLFPLTFAFSRRRHPALRPVAWGLLAAWVTRGYLAHTGAERLIYPSTLAHGDELLLGALLAQALHARPRQVLGLIRAGGAPLELACAGACALLAAARLPHEPPALGWWLDYLLRALATTALVAVIGLGRGPLARALSLAPLRRLGGLTYGGYLFHMYAVALAWVACNRLPLGPWPAATARAALAVPLSFAIAWCSRRWIEDPFLRLKARFPPRA